MFPELSLFVSRVLPDLSSLSRVPRECTACKSQCRMGTQRLLGLLCHFKGKETGVGSFLNVDLKLPDVAVSVKTSFLSEGDLPGPVVHLTVSLLPKS